MVLYLSQLRYMHMKVFNPGSVNAGPNHACPLLAMDSVTRPLGTWHYLLTRCETFAGNALCKGTEDTTFVEFFILFYHFCLL